MLLTTKPKKVSLKPALWALFFCGLAFAGCCFAETEPVFGFGDSRAPWHIEADSIQALGDDNYMAKGGVVVTRGEKRVSADSIRFDGSSQSIVATGNVVMTAGQDVLSGDRMEMNLAAGTGTIYGGELFLGWRHFYVAGDRIEKNGPDTFQADRFRITTCDPEDPDWYMTGRDLSVTVNGYGSMRHAAFWVKKFPVFYVPYLFFPVKTERQTGLLIPEMDYSRENGAEYAQPFFWAVDDSTDMTFYAHAMGRRGVRLGAEYRSFFSEQSKIAVMLDGLNDSKRNEPGLYVDYGYGNNDDQWLRTNAGRYWFRMKQNQSLPGKVDARVDLDIVSDQDYLTEFKKGYMGFDKSDAFFESFFGRDLDEAEETIRTNNLSLHRLWPRYSLNAALRWEDDVIKRRWADTDSTVQRLPVVLFNAVRQDLPGTPLNYDLESEYTFCFRRDGIKGHRTDIHPRIYLPLYWGHFLAVEPSAGIRETAWWMDSRDSSAPETDRSETRTVYDMKLDFSSELYRIFSLNRVSGAGLKHTFLPRLVYAYAVSPQADESFPVFDDNLDLIRDQSTITLSLENVFTLKRAAAGKDEAAYGYREVCRFNIEQSYDIKEAREDDPAGWQNGTDRRPFSPLRMELDLRPVDNFRIDVDAGWDKYENGWSEYDMTMNLFDKRGDALYMAYRYDRDIAETIYARGALALNRSLKLYGEHEYNYFNHMKIETSVGCLYNADCWSFDVRFTDEPDDDKLSFMIGLYGLGETDTGTAARNGF
jgi:LPS-assembly protein